MKRILFITTIIAFAVVTTACTSSNIAGMPNPWTECNDNFECGKKVAGFDFPLTLSNYKVRAMKGMFEVTYPLDEKRDVTVRKSFEETNGLDNSGDYTKYEKNELLPVCDGVNLNVRKNGDKIYVMYFAAESGVYSARCEKGMNDNEAIGVFNTIKDAETKYLNLIP